jgi:hypothetical protein
VKTILRCLAFFSFGIWPFLSFGNSCKEVKYDGQVYCPTYDAPTIARVAERNQFFAIINESHQKIAQVAKLVDEKVKCQNAPFTNRQGLLDCLENLYEARASLKAAAQRAAIDRAKVNALNLPAPIKGAFAKNMKQAEDGANLALVYIERSIKAAELGQRRSLEKWLDAKGNEWRTKASNNVFCKLISGETALGLANLIDLERSHDEADIFGTVQAFVKLRAARDKAVSGYKLCGISPDQNYREIEKALVNARLLVRHQDVQAVFRKACASDRVRKWPRLRTKCQTKTPTSELLFSIHSALAGEYREEQ